MRGHLLADAQLADGKVLAKDAAPRAMREKDGARATRAANGRLLSKVCIPTGDPGQASAPTKPQLTFQTVDTALAWAKLTRQQALASGQHALVQQMVLIELNVAGVAARARAMCAFRTDGTVPTQVDHPDHECSDASPVSGRAARQPSRTLDLEQPSSSGFPAP